MTEDDVREIFARVGEMCDDHEGRPDYVLIPCTLSFAITNHIEGSPPGRPNLTLLVDDKYRSQHEGDKRYGNADFAVMGSLVQALRDSYSYDEPFALPQQFATDFMHLIVRPEVGYAAGQWFWDGPDI